MPVILIVQNEPAEHAALCDQLRASGYHTLLVEDVRAAVETLNCIRADLVLVDVPRVDGKARAMLTNLRRREPFREMPIIFVGAQSAATDDGDDRPPNRSDVTISDGTRAQQLNDVMDHVRRYVEPLSVPYN